MNPHQFSVIKAFKGSKSMFFTGTFHKRRFPRLCHLFRIPEIVPVLTQNEREAEFHLSPSETYESLSRLRTSYPKFRWFYDTAILPDYTNKAMQKSFIIAVKQHGKKSWRYFIGGAYNTNNKLAYADTLDKATRMDIDTLKTTCQAIHINHKDYSYQALPIPDYDVHADCLEQYLEKNPPKSMYMTFKLKK